MVEQRLFSLKWINRFGEEVILKSALRHDELPVFLEILQKEGKNPEIISV